MSQTAKAHWEGDLKSGKGTIALGSGTFQGAYSFKTRFEGAPGTTPEELLGAAHAAVTLAKTGDKFSITRIDLTTRGVVAGLAETEFQRLAEDAKQNCIISRAIANVPMTLDAALAVTA